MSVAQTNLREPEHVNHDNLAVGGKYTPPPCPVVNGKPRVFKGTLPTKYADSTFGATDEGYRQYVIDPIVLVGNGNDADGQSVRFVRFSTKKFMRNDQPIEMNGAIRFLRAASILAKPQTNAEYDAAVRQTAGRTVAFTADWSAYNKDTGEAIDGWINFPDDPERPGQKKTILKAGDTYTVRDRQGNIVETKTVQSEVLFANLRLRFFQDAGKK